MTSTSRQPPRRDARRVAPLRSSVALDPLAAFRTPVRGHAFAARPPTTPPVDAQPVELRREPDNPRDPYAVAIWVTGPDLAWRIGYLDRSVAGWVAPRLDAGERFAGRLDGWVDAPSGRWRRPLVELVPEESALPAGRRGHTLPTDGLFGRPPGVRRRVLPAR